MSTKDILDSLFNGNAANFREQIHAELQSRAANAIDQYKQDLGEVMFSTEEAEDLDELSPALKARYVKKAQTSASSHNKAAKAHDRDGLKTMEKADKASERAARHGRYGHTSDLQNKAWAKWDKASEHDKKVADRNRGIKRATEDFNMSEARKGKKPNQTAAQAAIDKAKADGQDTRGSNSKLLDKIVQQHGYDNYEHFWYNEEVEAINAISSLLSEK